MGQAECARVWVLCGPCDLEGGHHVEGHVERHLAEAHIDVEEGGGVTLEPAGLDGEGAASDGPFGAVVGHGHTAAWGGGRGLAGADSGWRRRRRRKRKKGERGTKSVRTWIFPLHAIWVNEIGAVLGFTGGKAMGFFYAAVGVEVVPSPSWVCDDYV